MDKINGVKKRLSKEYFFVCPNVAVGEEIDTQDTGIHAAPHNEQEPNRKRTLIDALPDTE